MLQLINNSPTTFWKVTYNWSAIKIYRLIIEIPKVVHNEIDQSMYDQNYY